MARDPFDLPSDVHEYPVGFRLFEHRLDLGLEDFEIRLTERPVRGGAGRSISCRLDGYGKLWLNEVGGLEGATALAYRLFTGVPDEDHPVAERGNVLVTRLLADPRPTPGLGRTVHLALDVGDLLRRRNTAMMQGILLAKLAAKGIRGENAAAMVARRTGTSPRTVWTNWSRPLVKEVAQAFLSARRPAIDQIPHLADPWFIAGKEYEVGVGICYRMLMCVAEGKPIPEGLRWALAVHFEGYFKRNRPLPFEVIYGVAACVGILDKTGHARSDLALGRVIQRKAFIEFAASAAWYDFDRTDTDDFYVREMCADLETEKSWRKHKMWDDAYDRVYRRLRPLDEPVF